MKACKFRTAKHFSVRNFRQNVASFYKTFVIVFRMGKTRAQVSEVCEWAVNLCQGAKNVA